MVCRPGTALVLVLSLLALLLPSAPLAAQRPTITPLAPAGPLKLRPIIAIEPNRVPSSGPYSYLMWIVNTSTGSVRILSASCVATAPVVCGALAPDVEDVLLAAGDSVSVTVSYTTGSSTGNGTVALKVVDNVTPTHNTYTSTRTVKVVAGGKPQVVLFTPDVDNLDRGLCLTTGAGEAAGVSCGDLFVMHGMPAYRTLGRDRSLALYYNSATATPVLLVPARVSQASTIGYPDRYQVKVTVGTVSDSAEYLASGICLPCGGSYPYGEAQQVVLGRGLDLSGLATGRYSLSVRVRNIYPAGVFDSMLTGSVLVVNRSQSEYGRGWALLGVEQVLTDPSDSTRRIWLAGDGSIRVYSKTLPGDSVFQGAKGDAPDSLVRYPNAGSYWYRRDLKHGAAVSFDETGHHRETRNRVGAVTRFHWSNHSFGFRLDSIVVPPNDAVSRAYRLSWNAATGRLDRLTDPTGRVLLATLAGDQVRTLTDDDNQRTRFTYDATGGRLRTRIATRPGALGDSAITSYTYGNNVRVTQIRVQRDSLDQLEAITALTPWDEKGLALAYASQVSVRWDTAGLPSRIDGPLPGTGDAADITVDRFGAPKKILQLGLNATTSFWRDKPTLPALVT